jgi:5S rRNA maturation endonuclease (ribonuclease M5)
MATNAKLAVLIDADNDGASVIQELLAEVSRYGTATIKRAYGNWTTPQLQSWKEVLNKLAIQPIQQFSTQLTKTHQTQHSSSTPWMCCTQNR